MKKSDINFSVELDNENVPEKIYWDATDNPNEGLGDTRAIAISLWDHYSATNDQNMANDIENTCRILSKRLDEEIKAQKKDM